MMMMMTMEVFHEHSSTAAQRSRRTIKNEKNTYDIQNEVKLIEKMLLSS